jgi:hypothetical protein
MLGHLHVVQQNSSIYVWVSVSSCFCHCCRVWGAASPASHTLATWLMGYLGQAHQCEAQCDLRWTLNSEYHCILGSMLLLLQCKDTMLTDTLYLEPCAGLCAAQSPAGWGQPAGRS